MMAEQRAAGEPPPKAPSAPPQPTPPPQREASTLATLQSLVVAFVLAMTFRGFVTEGFVIPTGSMAPTLMGEHFVLHSDQTGLTYPVDSQMRNSPIPVLDPMLGPDYPLSAVGVRRMTARMGDRILVLKSLYPFSSPDRFDVVVFKNPTDPDGEAENYIKRLIGLPGEAVWLLDGDVFVAPASDCDQPEAFEVQRKPEYVQRAVWQPVENIDYVPIHPDRLTPRWAAPWSGEGWQRLERRYRCDTAAATTLEWDIKRWPITDWTSYNMLRGSDNRPVSDVRVAAAVVADQAGLSMEMQLTARRHVFDFKIAGGKAIMRYRPQDRPDMWVREQEVDVDLPAPGRVYDVEFWHVDQSMRIFVNGKRVGPPLNYDWAPPQRIEGAFGEPLEQWRTQRLSRLNAAEPALDWRFEGSPVTLYRVRLDRDLYYRADELHPMARPITVGSRQRENPVPPGFEDLVRLGSPAYGTHPDKLAVLGPDQFMMLGDNSPASSDSRLWGSPHPYVATQIDPAPFIVNRKLLLGKAWVVYFPSPYPLSENGRGIIPNFGKLRFIR